MRRSASGRPRGRVVAQDWHSDLAPPRQERLLDLVDASFVAYLRPAEGYVAMLRGVGFRDAWHLDVSDAVLAANYGGANACALLETSAKMRRQARRWWEPMPWE